MSNIDLQQQFKQALGNYPTGVTVVTAFTEDHQPIGLTVNSFASVSLDPTLILWSIDKKSSLLEPFVKADKFAVNILAEDQANVCMIFATKVEDRFGQISWEKSERDLPVIHGSQSQLECKTFQQIDAGDHIIFIGEVLHIHNEEKSPLLYHKRNFGAIPASFYEK